MRDVTVSPQGRLSVSICLFCKKNEVPIEKWNRRCPSCHAEQKVKDDLEKQQLEAGIGQRKPAAIIELEDENGNPTGETVFVDKFGREMPNPGYDLENDPRGHKFTGSGRTGTIIK